MPMRSAGRGPGRRGRTPGRRPRAGGSDIEVQITPGREGNYSLSTADVGARARHASGPPQFDGGYGGGGGRGAGIATALTARWQCGANTWGRRGRPRVI